MTTSSNKSAQCSAVYNMLPLKKHSFKRRKLLKSRNLTLNLFATKEKLRVPSNSAVYSKTSENLPP